MVLQDLFAKDASLVEFTRTPTNIWRYAKDKFKRMRGTCDNHLSSYLDEFMWHRSIARNENKFERALILMKTFYPRSSMNFENRWVLRSALNFASDGEVVREVDREFQRKGPEKAKADLAKECLTRVKKKREEEDDRKPGRSDLIQFLINFRLVITIYHTWTT
ncbi:hypothetical protein HELRODRAFT_163905 [Helobdella robusta]|uniref:Uncharacterized protein n=1 Tax=Helobdella robusta TaxID=6412 RepID=T1EUL6_HELRO|nr:hypothetical protein HELRODRAFT_163905 [Helobdella robusta]ESN96782.1 hypothetical protein HELRODRAFT_163905 [Helobdella robusta]